MTASCSDPDGRPEDSFSVRLGARDHRRDTMDDFHKYPELVTLDKRPEMLAVRQAVATEKLHGSNFRLYFPEGITSPGEVRFGSRNDVFAEGDAGFYGGRPVRWFKDNASVVTKLIETFG